MLGGAILAFKGAVLMPEQVLGKERFAGLQRLIPTSWYPVVTMLDVLEVLDQRLGEESLRKIGRTLFAQSHEAHVRESKLTAEELLFGLDALYRNANRGTDIGGWKILEMTRGRAVLEKTTPHHCIMEEGILDQALRAVQVPPTIYQSRCFRRGADACKFVITSSVDDQRWSKRGIQK
jgi:hypothetical protein